MTNSTGPWLPTPDEAGNYRYPDGCKIWKADVSRNGKPLWKACWNSACGHVMLRGCEELDGLEHTSFFETQEAAAVALWDGGEGPYAGDAGRHA